MTILVTGLGGQLGTCLATTLADLGPVIATTRTQLDLSRPDDVFATLNDIKPRLIVNAAAYTAVDQAESDEATAQAVNGDSPAEMARWAKQNGAALIHYSTDYVFDGSGHAPRLESDPTAPLNAYGRTKLAGEQAILASGADALIIRTSWVYDAQGRNFLNTMLRLGAERETLSVVEDQVGAPTPAVVLAQLTRQILRAKAGPFPTPLVHLACAGQTSWHGFALAIFEQARTQGKNLKVQEVKPIDSNAWPAPAKRPLNSRLDLTRLQQLFQITPPHWQDGLKAVMAASAGLL